MGGLSSFACVSAGWSVRASDMTQPRRPRGPPRHGSARLGTASHGGARHGTTGHPGAARDGGARDGAARGGAARGGRNSSPDDAGRAAEGIARALRAQPSVGPAELGFG